MNAKERLYLTADRAKLVREGDTEGAFLYAAPGDEIPASAVEKFGLVDGMLPGKAKAEKGGSAKEGNPGSNKEKKGGDNKGGGDGGTKADDLTAIKGIGPATAKVLAGAGLGSFVALAAVDPASPPAVEGLPPAFDWAAVTGDAKGKAEA